jgi:hypothetical protein
MLLIVLFWMFPIAFISFFLFLYMIQTFNAKSFLLSLGVCIFGAIILFVYEDDLKTGLAITFVAMLVTIYIQIKWLDK